jgi:hypothetical protein
MSDNLTTLISKVQNILGDASGTYFTTAVCTAAIRQALSEWNLRVPIYVAITITGVNDQYEYELNDVDADGCEIFDVLLRGTDPALDESVSLDYDDYVEDERVFFRLRRPVTSSDILLVRYTKLHTINGLDSATESTIPARYNQAMIDGGAYFSLFIRAVSRVETINLSADQTNTYAGLARQFASSFAAQMAYAVKTRKAAVSEPDKRAWGDQYSSWEQ